MARLQLSAVICFIVVVGFGTAIPPTDTAAGDPVQCDNTFSFLPPFAFKQEKSNFVHEFSLNTSRSISRINIKHVFNFDEDTVLMEAPVNVTYVDKTNGLEVIRPALINRYMNNTGGHITLTFSTNILTDKLIISTKHAIQYSVVSFVGCDPAVMCQNTKCQNGGTCLGENWCECPKGFYGNTCNKTASSTDILDMEFLALVNKTLISPAINFTTHAMVQLEDPPLLSITRRDHHHHHHAHMTAGGGFVTTDLHHGHNHHHGAHSSFNLHSNTNGYTHTTCVNFGHGHDHHHQTYMYTTYHHPHHGHGASLHYQDHHLHMSVHNQHSNHGHHGGHHDHHHHHVSVPFTPSNGPNQITSTFCPHTGGSIYVNGQHLASTPPPTSTSHPNIQSNSTLCMGSCTPSGSPNASYYLSNTAVAGLPLSNLVANNLAQVLSPSLGNLTPTHAPATTTTATTTTMATTTEATTTKATTTKATTTKATTTVSTTTPTTTTTTQSTAATTVATTTVPTGPLTCYDCQDRPTDGDCTHVKICGSGEVCALFKDPTGYTHECLNEKVCDFGKRYATMNCFKCCKTNVCNLFC